jgi:cardiolipin synthase A/B
VGAAFWKSTMTVIQVAIPVLRGRRRFHVEKGRRWSLVEHLMLDAVARTPASAIELSQKSNLPRRVVVEAFIRLMRVGWVELGAGPRGSIFQATPAGRAQLRLSELRAATIVQPRWIGFAIDQVAGSVFRARGEIPVRHPRDVSKSPESDALVYLEKKDEHSGEDLAELFAALEGEDEIIVRMDPSAEKLVERFAVATVVDGVPEGLPARANAELRAVVLARAKEVGRNLRGLPPVSPSTAPAEMKRAVRRPLGPALFDQSDLIIDGADHKSALHAVLTRARQQVIIHSTFISETAAMSSLPLFLGAAARGTKVHILWGPDEEKSAMTTTRDAIKVLQAAIREAGRSEHVIVHPFTTRSHAKLLISDDGNDGWSAIVGSCNWLYSNFESFETSIRVRDPVLVGDCVCHVATMSLGPPGVWHELASDLTVLGRRIGTLPRGTGRTAAMQLLLAPDHGALVLEARDHAARRIVVTSHRLGLAGRPMVIIPTVSAAKAKGVEVQLCYGEPTGALSGVDAAGLTVEFARYGVGITPIHRPRLHAKLLAWDDDSLAVTSQNWLSADPAEGALRREIGVFVNSTKVADFLLRRFEHARAQATTTA